MAAEVFGYVIVDHGSRVAQSNALLAQIASDFQRKSGHAIVEPAHMELAEPTIEMAFGRCAEQGANVVVVCPFFLLPGRHWSQDIPELTRQAAANHPDVRHLVTAPLGLLPAMLTLIENQISQCVAHASGGDACKLCGDQDYCQFQGVPPK